MKKEQNDHEVKTMVCSSGSMPYSIAEKSLTTNILLDSFTGTVVRELFTEEIMKTIDAYLDMNTIGNLSTFTWFTTRNRNRTKLSISEKQEGNLIVDIFYSALNFRDVMLATGRLSKTAYPTNSNEGTGIGIEYSGNDDNGNRVMGISLNKTHHWLQTITN